MNLDELMKCFGYSKEDAEKATDFVREAFKLEYRHHDDRACLTQLENALEWVDNVAVAIHEDMDV